MCKSYDTCCETVVLIYRRSIVIGSSVHNQLIELLWKDNLPFPPTTWNNMTNWPINEKHLPVFAFTKRLITHG